MSGCEHGRNLEGARGDAGVGVAEERQQPARAVRPQPRHRRPVGRRQLERAVHAAHRQPARRDALHRASAVGRGGGGDQRRQQRRDALGDGGRLADSALGIDADAGRRGGLQAAAREVEREAAQLRRHGGGELRGAVLLAQHRQQRPRAPHLDAERREARQQRHAVLQHRDAQLGSGRRRAARRPRRALRLVGAVEHLEAAARQREEQPLQQRVGAALVGGVGGVGGVGAQHTLEQHEQLREQRVVGVGRRRHAEQPEDGAGPRAARALAQQREERVRRRGVARRAQLPQLRVGDARQLELLEADGALRVVGARVERREGRRHRLARLEPHRTRHGPRHLLVGRRHGHQLAGLAARLAQRAAAAQRRGERPARLRRPRAARGEARRAALDAQRLRRVRRLHRAPLGHLGRRVLALAGGDAPRQPEGHREARRDRRWDGG